MLRLIECCDWCDKPLDFQPTHLGDLRMHVECRRVIEGSPLILGRELMYAALTAIAAEKGVILPRLDLHESVTHRNYNERQARSVRLD
jgi:hypothetical protein